MKHNSNAGAFAGIFPFSLPPLPQVIIMSHAKLPRMKQSQSLFFLYIRTLT